MLLRSGKERKEKNVKKEKMKNETTSPCPLCGGYCGIC